MAERRDYIIRVLTRHAGGPRAERARAVTDLNQQGYTDEEITEALRYETARLAEQERRIENMKESTP